MHLRSLPLSLAATAFALGCAWNTAAEDAVPLFNGKDLTGWEYDAKQWKVENGEIVGFTKDAPIKTNQFLIWTGGKPANFEFSAKIKLTGSNNSGIQYRSERVPNVPYGIKGYQCDIHPNQPYVAMLYEERGRGIVAQRGQRVNVTPDGKKTVVGKLEVPKIDTAEWHTYSVIAKGNHVQHLIDGKVATEFWDHEEAKRKLNGEIALQIHAGPPMEVFIKDVTLKTLPEAPLVKPEEVPVDAAAATPTPAPAPAK